MTKNILIKNIIDDENIKWPVKYALIDALSRNKLTAEDLTIPITASNENNNESNKINFVTYIFNQGLKGKLDLSSNSVKNLVLLFIKQLSNFKPIPEEIEITYLYSYNLLINYILQSNDYLWLKFLLDNGVNPNISIPTSSNPEKSESLLKLAINSGLVEIVATLLRSDFIEIEDLSVYHRLLLFNLALTNESIRTKTSIINFYHRNNIYGLKKQFLNNEIYRLDTKLRKNSGNVSETFIEKQKIRINKALGENWLLQFDSAYYRDRICDHYKLNFYLQNPTIENYIISEIIKFCKTNYNTILGKYAEKDYFHGLLWGYKKIQDKYQFVTWPNVEQNLINSIIEQDVTLEAINELIKRGLELSFINIKSLTQQRKTSVLVNLVKSHNLHLFENKDDLNYLAYDIFSSSKNSIDTNSDFFLLFEMANLDPNYLPDNNFTRRSLLYIALENDNHAATEFLLQKGAFISKEEEPLLKSNPKFNRFFKSYSVAKNALDSDITKELIILSNETSCSFNEALSNTKLLIKLFNFSQIFDSRSIGHSNWLYYFHQNKNDHNKPLEPLNEYIYNKMKDDFESASGWQKTIYSQEIKKRAGSFIKSLNH